MCQLYFYKGVKNVGEKKTQFLEVKSTMSEMKNVRDRMGGQLNAEVGKVNELLR